MDEHAWQRELEELSHCEARARAILDVKPGTSQEDLRLAYRRVAKECHPDLNPGEPGAQECFKDALAAYKFLAEGVCDRRLVERGGSQDGPDDSGYCLDNSWGYYLWWSDRFFGGGVP